MWEHCDLISYWKIYVCYRSCSRLKRCSLIASSICLCRDWTSHRALKLSLGVLKVMPYGLRALLVAEKKRKKKQRQREPNPDAIATMGKLRKKCIYVFRVGKLNFENFLSLFMTYYVSSSMAWKSLVESMPFLTMRGQPPTAVWLLLGLWRRKA